MVLYDSQPEIWSNKSKIECACLNSTNCSCACPTSDLFSYSGTSFLDISKTQFLKRQSNVEILVDENFLWTYSKITNKGLVLNKRAAEIYHNLETPKNLSGLNRIYPEINTNIMSWLLTRLFDYGLIIDENINTVYEFKPSKALIIWMNITNQCNLSCNYCYIQKSSTLMSTSTAYAAIDKCFEVAINNGFDQVILKYSGGEPGLYINHVLNIHDYAVKVSEKKQFKLAACLFTNGTTLTPNEIKNIAKRNIEVMLSIDGIGEYHSNQRYFTNGSSTYPQVEKTLNLLTDAGISPQITITITNQNAKGLVEIVSFLVDNNLRFNFNLYRGENLDLLNLKSEADLKLIKENLLLSYQVIINKKPQESLFIYPLDRVYFSTPHEYPCGVQQNYLVIDTDGKISKCQMEMENKITDIYAKDPLQEIRSSQNGIINPSVDEKISCLDCLWRWWCAGGCPKEANRTNKNYASVSPTCFLYKQILPEIIRLEAKRIIQFEEHLTAPENL